MPALFETKKKKIQFSETRSVACLVSITQTVTRHGSTLLSGPPWRSTTRGMRFPEEEEGPRSPVPELTTDPSEGSLLNGN